MRGWKVGMGRVEGHILGGRGWGFSGTGQTGKSFSIRNVNEDYIQ